VMSNGCIYSLADPMTGLLCYVGQTRHAPSKRLEAHIREGEDRSVSFPITSGRKNWLAYLRTIGVSPVMTVLGEYSVEALDNQEGKWLARLLSEECPVTNTWYPGSTWRYLDKLGVPFVHGLHVYNALTDCPYYWLLLEDDELPDRVLTARIARDRPDILAEMTAAFIVHPLPPRAAPVAPAVPRHARMLGRLLYAPHAAHP